MIAESGDIVLRMTVMTDNDWNDRLVTLLGEDSPINVTDFVMILRPSVSYFDRSKIRGGI